MIRKLLPFAALSIGIAATVWLIAAARLTSILDSVAQVGWGIAAVVAVRAIMITINGVAWRLSLTKLVEVPYAVFPFVRWIREAIDVLLPVASIGGSLASARLLTFWRVSVAMALAGVFADVFLQTVAQALFASAGALLLARMVGLGTLLPQLLLGVAAAAVVLGGFYLLQRYSAARWIDRAMSALTVRTAWRVQRGEIGVQSAMDKIWRGRRLYLATALVIHVIAWASGTLEVWLTLHFMHWPVSLERAIVLESLGASISSAAFLIPGSWGVQEGGYILIGHLLGVPAPLALSLSLVKRVPDLVLGAPGLLAWADRRGAALAGGASGDCLTCPPRAAASRPPYSAGWFGFTNVRLRLSNSSILAPFLCMMTLCCSTESVLFQAQ
jgi:glycosyltransferase 2 family protein